jgi:malyl-CoA/(S)-citramalyl-CoA lyase
MVSSIPNPRRLKSCAAAPADFSRSMSFFTIEQAPARLNRSELAVPGSQPQLFEKAAKSAADVVFLDLEDAVAPDDKAQAGRTSSRPSAIIDWGNKQLSVRINGLDTHYMYRDVVDVLEQASDRLDLIMIPKVGTASDVYAIDMMVTQIETAKGRKKRIGFELIIETALGMQNVSPTSPPHRSAMSRCISVWPTMPPRRARAPPRSAAPTRIMPC